MGDELTDADLDAVAAGKDGIAAARAVVQRATIRAAMRQVVAK